jgi:hypothetical protein
MAVIVAVVGMTKPADVTTGEYVDHLAGSYVLGNPLNVLAVPLTVTPGAAGLDRSLFATI